MNFDLRISMISLMQNDLNAAIAFYEQLGCTYTFQVPGKWAEFDVQGVKLFLYQVDQQLSDHFTGVVLHVNDIYSFFNTFKDSIEFVTEPTDLEYAYIARFKDPGHNIIGLVQPTPERVQQAVDAHRATSKDEGLE